MQDRVGAGGELGSGALPAEADFHYDGFISYRHDARQSAIARSLQPALHQFAKPWYRLRAVRLYRDETNLSANPNLWGSIQEALNRSRYLLLIASPQAADSRWVQREVDHWVERRGPESILIVLTDGTLDWDEARKCFSAQSTALPARLLDAYGSEPFWIDLTWVGDNIERSTTDDPRFGAAVAAVSAAIRGVEKDALISEDARQLRLRMRQALGALAVISALGVAAAIAAAGFFAKRQEAVAGRQLAAQQRDAARLQESRALARIAAKALDDGDPQAAILIALEALPSPGGFGGERPFSDEAAAMLHTAIAFNREIDLFPHGDEVVLAKHLPEQPGRVVTAASDGTISVWESLSRAAGAQVAAHPAGLAAAALSADGKLLVTGDKSGKVKAWSLDDAAFRLVAESDFKHPVQELLVVGGKTAIVLIEVEDGPRSAHRWDVASRAPATTMLETEMPIVAHASPNGSMLAIGPMHSREEKSTLSVWDFASAAPRLVAKRHIASASLTTAAFDHDGKHLFVAHSRESSRILKVDAKLTMLRKFSAHDDDGNTIAAAFDRSGKYLATGGKDGSIQVRLAFPTSKEREYRPHDVRRRGSDPVIALSFDRDARQLLSVGGNTVTLWAVTHWENSDLESEAVVTVATTPTSRVVDAGISPDGARFVAGSTDGTVRVWTSEIAGLRRIALDDGKDPSKGPLGGGNFQMSEGGEFVIGYGFDPPAQLKIWDARTGKRVHEAAQPAINGSQFSLADILSARDGETTVLVLGFFENVFSTHQIKVLKFARGALQATEELPGNLRLRSLSRDGSVLITSESTRKYHSGEHSLLVWNMRAGLAEKPLVVPARVTSSSISSLSPDGRTLFTASVDKGRGCIWRLAAASASCVPVALAGNEAITAAALNSQGTLLALAGAQRSVSLVDVSGDPKAKASVRLSKGHAKVLHFDPRERFLLVNNDGGDEDDIGDTGHLWAYTRSESKLETLSGSRSTFEPHQLQGDALLTGGIGARTLLWNIGLEVPISAAIPLPTSEVEGRFGPGPSITFGPARDAIENRRELVVRSVAYPDYRTRLADLAQKVLVRCLTREERLRYGLSAHPSGMESVAQNLPGNGRSCDAKGPAGK